MSKQVYISADYAELNGDRDVVEVLNTWASDKKHKVDFVDMAEVVSGSVSKDPDCRICDLIQEFNRQINASSAVIFVVGDMTAYRQAGSSCPRNSKSQYDSQCTPYKQNSSGAKACKVAFTSTPGENDDYGCINTCSYLRHEFEQAKKKKKQMIIVYNSLRKEESWLPTYMSGYESLAVPFWIKDAQGNKVGNYEYIKKELGYE